MKHQIIIIGSGLGGLLSAVLLAKEGYDVAILEQNKQVGGCLQTFSFDKKVFDSAVHYIGSLGQGEVQHKIFKYAGIMADLKVQRLDRDRFDALIFDDRPEVFAMGQGTDIFRCTLLNSFPEEEKAIDAYLELLENTCAAVPLYNLRSGDERGKQVYSALSLSEVIARTGASEDLRNVLVGNAILYAGSARTSWLTHALVVKSYINSSWRCIGGASQIAKLLWRQLQALGGTIYRHQKVEKLLCEGGLVSAAQTASGNIFHADIFISNIHPKRTLTLLEEDKLLKKVYTDRIRRSEESVACLMLNIVLEPGKVAYRNYNINWNAGDPLRVIERSGQCFPANYSIYYTEDEHRKGFAESVSILSYIDAAEFSDWENSYNNTIEPGERGQRYKHYKSARARQVLEKVAERFPEIEQFKRSWKVATPLTYRDYQGSEVGSLYGIHKDVDNASATNFSVRTRIPNLYLTGQNVNLHGILGVSMTALQTTAAITGMEDLLDKINRA